MGSVGAIILSCEQLFPHIVSSSQNYRLRKLWGGPESFLSVFATGVMGRTWKREEEEAIHLAGTVAAGGQSWATGIPTWQVGIWASGPCSALVVSALP